MSSSSAAHRMGPQQRTAFQYYLYGLDERQPMERCRIPASWTRFRASRVRGDRLRRGATAWSTGKKVPNGTTGLGPNGEDVPTLLDIAEGQRGMSTGLVNDHDITNATLAAFGSPVPDRDLKVDIAKGYLDRGVDVLFGGGEKYWYPRG